MKQGKWVKRPGKFTLVGENPEGERKGYRGQKCQMLDV